MDRKSFLRHLWSFSCLLFAVLFLVGCAIPHLRPRARVETPPEPPPPREAETRPQPPLRPPPPPQTYVRTFPGFVALIAQPGDTFSTLAAKYLNDPSLGWFISEFNDSKSLSPGQELIIPLQFRERGGLSFRGYQAVPVIAYHKFSKDKADAMTVREIDFDRQMRYLRENGYRVLTLDEFFDFLDFDGMIPPKSVVITIDDGWPSIYDIAFPILKKYGYPATLFVYTDFIRDKALDWKQIAEMSRNGIDVQCHTKTHRNVGKRNTSESFREYFESAKKELAESADIIHKRLNKEVRYLAYPYGDTNNLVIALLRKLGYRGAFTVKRGSNPSFIHHYQINRSMIYGTFNLHDFEMNLAYFNDQGLNE